MAAGSGQPRSHLFTVRVWQEKLGSGQTEWRGTVQHVPSGETAHFRGWPGLIEHLQQTLEGSRPAGSA